MPTNKTHYWLSFRVEEETSDFGETPSERRKAIKNAVETFATKYDDGNAFHWDCTTSFYLFRSTSPISSIASAVKEAIDVTRDVFLISTLEGNDARYGGNVKKLSVLQTLHSKAKAA